jgi:uncharacterized heparinase superfamily protein
MPFAQFVIQTLKNRVVHAVRHHASRLTYNSPLYNWSLGGTVPERLLFSPCDLWQGDADNARWLVHSGAFSIGGDRLELHNADWHPEDVSDQWLEHIHGFDWIRDLRALGGDIGRRSARHMIENWIYNHQNWDALAWRSDILGRRLGNLLAGYDFFGESADEKFQAMFLDSIVRQLRHLGRALPGMLHGLPLLYAIKGLAYGGMTLEGRENYLEQALHLLDEQIDKQILSDGGHITRNPQALFETIRILIDIRAGLRQAGYPGIEKIQHGLDRAVPALRFFRHGDGAFALFNNCQTNDADALKNTVMQSNSRARTLNSLPHSGYERVSMGRSLLIADVGKPPAWPYDAQAHIAPLSFEFSHGRERIFVNCGTHPTCPKWQDALRSTPAHNTLIIDDRNMCDVNKDGSPSHRPKKIVVDRDDKKNSNKNDTVLIDACHDGYLPVNGITHRRRFYLADKGHDFRGEDNLNCATGLATPHDIALRFHLHPNVTVSLIKGGTEALLRLNNGTGWRFTIVGGELELENSVYLGTGIRPRKTKQLVIRGKMTKDHAQFKWALQLEN